MESNSKLIKTVIRTDDDQKKNISNNTVIENKRNIIIRIKEDETPFGTYNCVGFNICHEDENKKENTKRKESKKINNIPDIIKENNESGQNKVNEEISLLERIKNWFSSWNCCNGCTCIDDNTEIRNLDTKYSIINMDGSGNHLDENVTPGC